MSRPLESAAELTEFFRAAEKPPDRWRIGTEHEKVGLFADTLERVPYEGERGIAAILADISNREGWKAVHEKEHLIALETEGASITLEPGGQIELSGAPLRTIHETCDEFHTHLEMMKQVSEPRNIVWLGLGIDPIHSVEEAPRMPKERYRIMRDYLPPRGEFALHMMHLTCTVQANFDYASEADMVEKMRTAMGVSAIVSAIFANSSLSRGEPSGFMSQRVHIWRHVDPDRCGLLHFVFDREFEERGYECYTEWALDVPMFFIVREGAAIPMEGRSFRRFLAEGRLGHRATHDDWRLHLTTVFPEVRLKNVIEVRGADAVPAGHTCSLPALWKGILYDPESRRAAYELVEGWDVETREGAMEAVAREGLQAQAGGRPLLELARELVTIASDGLRRIGHAGRTDADERSYLEPIEEQIEIGESPGRVVLNRWQGEWKRSFERLIDYARY